MPTILVFWSPGRTHEQKAAVVREITEVMVTQGGARREDVPVIFQDIQPGDFGRGGEIPAPPVMKTTDGGSSV